MGALKRPCPDEFDQFSKPARRISEKSAPLRRSPRIYSQKYQQTEAEEGAPSKRRSAPTTELPQGHEEDCPQLVHYKSGAGHIEDSDSAKKEIPQLSYHDIGCQSDELHEDVLNNSSRKEAVPEDIKKAISSAIAPLVLDGQSDYRCPSCSFPCWLCNTAKILDKPPLAVEEQSIVESMTTPTTSRTSSKRKRNDGLIYLGPREKHFEEYILASAAVEILDVIQPSEPQDIWKAAVLHDPRSTSQVFLQIDRKKADEIATQVIHSHLRKYDETALTKIITKYLAPFDAYISRNGPEALVSLCRDKWKPGKHGPLLAARSSYTYDWDIEPDMSYMVAVNILPNELRSALRGPDMDWVLAEPAGVCPYLTLEFKCTEKSGKDSAAVCQVAAASVVWVHQRKRLKEVLGSSDMGDLQHYSIVLNSTGFQVWLTKFEGSMFVVRLLDVGPLNRPDGVEQYVKWWNAIHRWGLGPNALSFQKDVEALWEKTKQNALTTPPFSDARASPSAMPPPALPATRLS
ncbi:hypothetical protein MMC11_003960 [Xylographa trunciseda]|nr:hypothetical protein [Xylographa trunciseda]